MANDTAHPELHALRQTLKDICSLVSEFRPMTPRPPIIDTSLDFEPTEESHWLQPEQIPGIRKLRDAIQMDLEALEKFLQSPESKHLPALSTNAPYLISVWNELLCAPTPVTAVMKTFQPTASGGSNRKPGVRQKQNPVKVDVVADNGRRWIRVNTIKNSRLLAEFREIDSYVTSSEDESDDDAAKPSLAQNELDNSVLRMGRSLLDAAKANPLGGSNTLPRITMRLTRLALSPTADTDPRIAQTVRLLEAMDIEVEFGEQTDVKLPRPRPEDPISFKPTPFINLDLSILIALVSDLTHSHLPSNVDEADERFIPTQSYREWKQERKKFLQTKGQNGDDPTGSSSGESKHSRALANQLVQEMYKGLFQEMHEQLLNPPRPRGDLQFWTTPEARDRCIRIISKIGGVNEKRRAHALFPSSNFTSTDVSSLDTAEKLFWQDSRYPPSFIPVIPIHIFPAAVPSKSDANTFVSTSIPRELPPFFKILSQTCRHILSHETMPHPRAVPEYLGMEEIQRAAVTKANPKLTAHTVESLLWGAELGWTTLTANKSSVKAIIREMKTAIAADVLRPEDYNAVEVKEDKVALDGPAGSESDKAAIWVSSSEDIAGDRNARGTGKEVQEVQGNGLAALWVVDPRSLAEGMRSDYSVPSHSS
ncbi:hypothetical protein PC9H_000381 [Pleurotus ostreatus]|uniref:DUF1308 domain-containing protein n=1 Tax=Pleurotus ostreatus TaxID=5322 RepID=A0A8H7A8H8_PLEOS|nr:uncharacterized protein PC9H_000381 [Pleurotus ostreatus]KAF7440040.1 hypothetical protein PC9H_000381 [Pleurotus ostreatus]